VLEPAYAICVHAFVFEPHEDATRAEDRIGGLKHYYFASNFGSAPAVSSEWIVRPPTRVTDAETVNMRVGASIAPDGRIAVAWGLYPGKMYVATRNGGGCYGGGWSKKLVEGGLQHTFYYPRITVAGNPAGRTDPPQSYYTAIQAQMDQEVPTMCDGSANSVSIYRKANYWEDSRNGAFRRETVANLWNPCSTVFDRVQNLESYVDVSSRTHMLFLERKNGATRSIEHWYKPGDSFKQDPAFNVSSTCSASNPCRWTKKIKLNWASKGVTQVRLFEAKNATTGEWSMYYWANSGTAAYIARFTGSSLGADALVPITTGGLSGLYNMRAYVAGRGGGTRLSEPYIDAIMHGVKGSYYVRIPKSALASLVDAPVFDGYLSRARYGANVLRVSGWACVVGRSSLPTFELWAQSGSTRRQLPIESVIRSRRSDADARCKTSADHGYELRVAKSDLAGYVGWDLSVTVLTAGKKATLSDGSKYRPHRISAVTNGHVDNTRFYQGRSEVRGWACEKGRGPIRVHLYAGGRAGVGTFVGSVSANRQRADVADNFANCDSGDKRRGFLFRLTQAQRNAHHGKKAFVHVITPTNGVGNPLVSGSGTRAIK